MDLLVELRVSIVFGDRFFSGGFLGYVCFSFSISFFRLAWTVSKGLVTLGGENVHGTLQQLLAASTVESSYTCTVSTVRETMNRWSNLSSSYLTIYSELSLAFCSVCSAWANFMLFSSIFLILSQANAMYLYCLEGGA